ncbi:hypothetical protein CesoFtcFv8_025793 [Champsocephalus esox]|uniref:Uncharacterized protein n=1 Tax=Champsocephalus esox TaxID=159716 RepID=A0AAN8B1H9_9TELE|nr:hypothetical protein CesoFtcFv8_025793 [Champsocephalus esox]
MDPCTASSDLSAGTCFLCSCTTAAQSQMNVLNIYRGLLDSFTGRHMILISGVSSSRWNPRQGPGLRLQRRLTAD